MKNKKYPRLVADISNGNNLDLPLLPIVYSWHYVLQKGSWKSSLRSKNSKLAVKLCPGIIWKQFLLRTHLRSAEDILNLDQILNF